MAKDHGASVKDDEVYEKLRAKGASKEKAARIANAKAGGGRPFKKGGQTPRLEKLTKARLYDRARRIGIEGRSKMAKDELIAALRAR